MADFNKITDAIKVLATELNVSEGVIVDRLLQVPTPSPEQLAQWAEEDRQNDLELELYAAKFLQ